MFERPATGESALLVHMQVGPGEPNGSLAEFEELAVSAGAKVEGVVGGARQAPDSRLFAGRGKAEEIRQRVQASGVQVVIFNHALTPSQERNLERLIQARVLDRTGLILDIFAQRARSFEGKLQVELAQLRHLSTRLVRGWTHLERQKGGIGLRGPGETQLESDRRMIGNRIKQLQARLERVRKQRQRGRNKRQRAEVPTISLVGYTNAGKSTLFNQLVDAGVYAADQLFATLDPTLRRLPLDASGPVVLVDTVGFVRDLPPELVAAFHSTLEETSEAALLLHVVDASDPAHVERAGQVQEVLERIGAQDVPQIQVYNKIDAVDDVQPHVERDSAGDIRRVWLSAQDNDGLDLLRDALGEHFRRRTVRRSFCLPPSAGRLRALLFELGSVLTERVNDQGEWLLDVEIQRVNLARLERQEEFARVLQT